MSTEVSKADWYPATPKDQIRFLGKLIIADGTPDEDKEIFRGIQSQFRQALNNPGSEVSRSIHGQLAQDLERAANVQAGEDSGHAVGWVSPNGVRYDFCQAVDGSGVGRVEVLVATRHVATYIKTEAGWKWESEESNRTSMVRRRKKRVRTS